MNLVESWRPDNRRDLHPLVHLDSPARNPGGSHTGPCGVEGTFLKRGVPPTHDPKQMTQIKRETGRVIFSSDRSCSWVREVQEFLYHSF